VWQALLSLIRQSHEEACDQSGKCGDSLSPGPGLLKWLVIRLVGAPLFERIEPPFPEFREDLSWNRQLIEMKMFKCIRHEGSDPPVRGTLMFTKHRGRLAESLQALVQ
jgi:hypothetical protein